MRIKANEKKGGNARRLEIESAKRQIISGAMEIGERLRANAALADWALDTLPFDRVLHLFGNYTVYAMERRLCARLRKTKPSDNIFGRYHVMALAKMV